MNIILADKNETKNMRDFLYGIEEYIYGKSTKRVTLNGEEITLDVIANRMEKMTLKLLNEGKYDRLTYEQKIILNIPVIQWKSGYYYGAAFMYCWFNGENKGKDRAINIDEQNFSELFQQSSFFQQHLKETTEEIETGSLYNVPTAVKCLNNIKRAIESADSIDISIPENYKEADRYAFNYASFFYSHVVSFYNTVDINHNTVMNDIILPINQTTC